MNNLREQIALHTVIIMLTDKYVNIVKQQF